MSAQVGRDEEKASTFSTVMTAHIGGEHDPDVASLSRHPGVVTQESDAGMVGVDEHEQRRHHAEDEVQRVAFGEGQRQAVDHAGVDGEEGQ
jgi:hypothetical protein